MAIYVLAGPNGAGKSSIGGAMIRAMGADYFDPDEAAAAISAANPGTTAIQATSAAWHEGKRLLERAISERGNFAFETTLGGSTITLLLARAIAAELAVNVWYVALDSPELHLARVAARVARGGHAIPEHDVRRRYDASRHHLIDLMPGLASLRVYDNSIDADLAAGQAPEPRLMLHLERGTLIAHCDLASAPTWVKPILMTALAPSR
ncbi:MAG: zeta toxin family protein [Kofleriaceae bacterium]